MQIDYLFLTDPSPSQIEGVLRLYRLQGWWGAPTDHDHELTSSVIRGSHCFAVAEGHGRVIGMGRAISDRVSDAYIQDVTVDAAFRGRGIGSRIVSELLSRLKQDGIDWIGLGAEAGTYEFYRRAGFTELPGCIVMLKKNP